MGQRSLNTVITIGGSVDGSFGKLGSALLNLGSMLDTVSDKAFNFGKESVLSYRDYDDLMRETQAVGEFTTAQMTQLDTLNKTLAQTTTYTPNQIAEAEVLLGQLGLTTTQIQDMLIPSLNLAMAGNISLADSVGYLYAALKSTGAPLSYADELTDQMAVAAAKGAADVDTLGESLERLGSGATMFKGGSREILTLLTLISDFGEDMRGAEAGTALRNFALSLFAPTGNTKEVIAMLETLGMTTDEYNAYLEEEGIVSTAAAAAIKELGLSLYDEYGNARSMLEIIPQLNASLSSMPDEVRNPILRQIFGKRGFTTASNLMAVVGSFDDMYTAIDNSDGAAERMVETMQGGLGGALRELEAASTLVKNTFGEQAADDVQFVADLLHGMSVDISNMDPTVIAGITGALEVVAGAGPALLAAGGFVRGLGLVFGSKGAMIATAATAALGLINGIRLFIQEHNETSLQEMFGTLDFDTTAIIADISSISEAFAQEHAEVTAFTEALNASVTAYEGAAEKFAGKLLSGLITGNTFTPEEQQKLIDLGDEMAGHLLDGIQQSSAASMSYWEMLWGESYSETDDPALRGIMEAEKSIYEASIEEANQIGANLRSALVSALTNDGIITDDEYDKIRSYMDKLNAAMARAAQEARNEQEYVDQQMRLHKAQSMGLDAGRTLLQENAAARDTLLSEMDAEYLARIFGLEYRAEQYGIDVSKELAEAEKEYEAKKKEKEAQYAENEFAIIDAMMQGSDHAEAWDFLKYLYEGGEPVLQDGAYQFAERDWSKFFPEGRPGEGEENALYDQLYDLWHAEHGFWGTESKLSGAFGDALSPEGLAQYQEMLDASLDAMNYTFESNPIQVPVAPTAEMDITGMEAGASEAGSATEAALMDAYGDPLLSGTVDETGMTSDATTAGSAAASAVKNAWGNPVLTATIRYVGVRSGSSLVGGSSKSGTTGSRTALFAEGGRATEASIFGEAGPEWAIPEEHSSRTAALLDAARKASGFGWGELITRTGGLNANPQNRPAQLVYSPTIYANDATDVDAKLREDKERLDRWWRDKQFREEMEAFA